MIHTDENNEGYFHGDKVRKTGKTDVTTYSCKIAEYEFLEGRNKGKTFWQPSN